MPSRRPRALACLRDFLAGGGDPNTLCNTQWAPPAGLLDAAAKYGWDDAVVSLLAAGADMHTRADAALRAVIVENRDPPTARLPILVALLAAGANVHAENDAALTHAASNVDFLPILTALLAAGANVHAHRDRALANALRHRCHEAACILLRHGASATAAWPHFDGQHYARTDAAAVLDGLATEINAVQRHQLAEQEPSLFPAIRALLAAEQRQQRTLPRRSLERGP